MKDSKFLIRRWDPLSPDHLSLPKSADDTDDDSFEVEDVEQAFNNNNTDQAAPAPASSNSSDEATESEEDAGQSDTKPQQMVSVLYSNGTTLKPRTNEQEAAKADTSSHDSSPCKLPLKMIEGQNSNLADESMLSEEAIEVIR